MNRYLTGDPLPALLESPDPFIKYLAMRDIAGVPEALISNAYSEMKASAPVRELLSIEKGGVLGNLENLASIGTGSVWHLARAIAFGLDSREPVILNTIDKLFTRWQTPSGGISGRWRPLQPDACLTGELLRIALLAGVSNSRTRRAAAWIMEHQRKDGGWLHSPVAGTRGMIMFFLLNRSGSGLALENNIEVGSCIVASTACAMALSCIAPGDEEVRNCIGRAAEFLLSHRLIQDTTTLTTPANSNLDLSLNPRIGYPVFCQYDVLYGLLCIARAGFFNDSRTGSAFNSVMSRQSPAGIIPYNNYRPGMMFSKRANGKVQTGHDHWTTLNFLRTLKAAGEL